MLNLWIGLCKGVAGLPKNIRELGYAEKAVEFEFKNRDLDTCHPELVIASEKVRHTALMEWKKGPNTETDQLKRYSRVTSTDLQTKAFLSAKQSQSHDVIVIGKREHAERLMKGLKEGPFDFPLLLVETDGLCLAHNSFKGTEISKVFAPKLIIDWARVPMSFVPINEESALWEVADIVIPRVLEHMLRRESRIRAYDLCPLVCPTWSIIHKRGRAEILVKISKVLEEAASNEFAPYLDWRAMSNNDSSIDVRNNPLDYGADRRSTAFRSLARAHQEFRTRLLAGKRGDRQMTLPFSE